MKPPSPPVVGGHPALSHGRVNHPIRRVVIHSAVTPCEPGMARRLGHMNASGSTGGSWHYATDPGETIQCSYDSYDCYHAPPSRHSLGIEMADTPGPVPDDKPWTAAWKAARRAWRWRRPNHRLMFDRTVLLTARLCVAYDIPTVFLTPRMLRQGRRGVTTHANVSRAWGQSTHWDPGFWPRRRFMRRVRAYAKHIREREN